VAREIPEYVAEYLLERMVNQLPDEVLDVLVTLSPEQIEALARVGRAFDEAGHERHLVTFSIH
jgi:restriction endonuclease Mrr